MPSPDPIATYRALRAELMAAAVSPATCQRLLDAFDAWEGGADFLQSAGLVADPTRYTRNARHGLRLDDRDSVIRDLATRATGSNWRRAQTIAAWRERLARGDSLLELPADVPDLLAIVGDLSARHMCRILGGDRSA